MDKKTLEKLTARSENAAKQAEAHLQKIESILSRIETEFEEIKGIKSSLIKEQKKSIKKQLLKMSQKAAKKAAKKNQAIAKVKSQIHKGPDK